MSIHKGMLNVLSYNIKYLFYASRHEDDDAKTDAEQTVRR